ncbi:MAG: response regulator [Lentisphaeria bacterium]|nr:response regulator [Lentisphaeria bacterium]
MPAATTEGQGQAGLLCGPLTILLVEDNPLDAELFREFLADAGVMDFALVHVPRLSQALERLDAGGVDIIFLDFLIPDSDGFASLAKLTGRAPQVPVIMLTGLDDDGVGLRAVAAGAQDYLVKGSISKQTIWRILRYAIVRKCVEEQEREKQLLTARLSQAQRAESLVVVAGGIAHGYNNLLTVILGNATLALTELPEDSPLRSLLEDVCQAAQRGVQLTAQMLAYSGKGQFQKDTIDLSRLVVEMTPLLEPALRHRGRLQVAGAPRPMLIEGAVHELRQVVISLVANAAEALPSSGGTVRVSVGGVRLRTPLTVEQGSITTRLDPAFYATVTVSDTGQGIPQEHRHRIFDPFFTTKFTGRGMGLSGVLGIVRSHGGAVRVTSQEDEGTTVQVFLPVDETAQPAYSLPQPAVAATECRFEGVALVIDPEPLVVSITRKILERYGMTVISAPEWRAGAQLAQDRGGEVRLVLLDVERLPAEAPVVAAFRKYVPSARFLLCSGAPRVDDRERPGIIEGCLHLQKPFQPDQLLEKVKSLLR